MSKELRTLAASELAFAESRMVTYRDDGAPVPDPIRRLHGLAKATLDALPTLGDMLDSRDADARATKATDSLRQAREGIYALGMMLETLNASLDGAPIAPSAEPARAPSSPPSVASPSARWPDSGLFHGLVLVNPLGERRLFSEAAKGQYQVQAVAPDGATAGEPWSTQGDRWPASEADANPQGSGSLAHVWTEAAPLAIKPALRRYDDMTEAKPVAPRKTPAADRTIALPGMADIAPAPQKTIADYVPPDAQWATWAAALSKAIDRTIEPTEVKSLFAAWQAAHGTEVKPNPAAAFWQFARKAVEQPTSEPKE